MEDREHYPGSSREIGDRLPPPEPMDWGKPVRMMWRGVETEFYTVGQVAAALNRSPVTIRKWERSGWLPVTLFRSQAQVRQKARRLYTRAQLEVIVAVAYEEGLMNFTRGADGYDYPKAHVTETKFAERVRKAFVKLAAMA